MDHYQINVQITFLLLLLLLPPPPLILLHLLLLLLLLLLASHSFAELTLFQNYLSKFESSQQKIFYGMGFSATRPTLNLKDQGIPFVLVITFDLSDIGGPTSNYAAASIVLSFI